MPWTCPTCQTQIHHDGEAPEPRQIYHCHACRRELVLDEDTHKLIIAPLPAPNDPRR